MIKQPYSIIANPEGKAWEFAQAVHAKLRKQSDDFELNTMKVTQFKDDEFKTKIERNVRGKQCFFLHDSSLDPARWFLELAMANYSLQSSAAESVIDVLPYMRFARQDRKDESRVPITTRLVADVISLYTDRVMTLDVHNPVIQNAYPARVPFDNLHSYPTVIGHLNTHYSGLLKDCVVMSTDVGGATRAKSFATRAGIEDIVIGYKTRPKPGAVGGIRLLGEPVQGRNVLIVDDLTDSGGTMVKAADVARSEGAAAVYGYTSHGLFTNGVDKVVNAFDKFFIGDTVYQAPHPKLEVISFVPLFAEVIYRTTQGESLSALFE